MRAILRCNAQVTQDGFRTILHELQWWPPQNLDNRVLSEQKEQLLSSISPEDIEIVKATVWYMIYSNNLKTWGLVSSPNPGVVEIRLRNQVSAQLRRASEQVVTDLQNYLTGKLGGTAPAFEFKDTIEVLEPNSQHHAYYGEPLPTQPRRKWKLAKTERRPEWVLGHILLAIAVLLVSLTIPPMGKRVSAVLSKEWFEWGEGTLG
jgi:hypothetical protein